MPRTDPAAINFIQAMRRIAISRCEDRDGEPGLCLEVTASGNLTCEANPSGKSPDGDQLYHASFEINGLPISRIDAEVIAMGEVAA